MKAKKWKQIQRFAYLFYALLYLHIMLLFIPLAKDGKDGYYFSVIVYTAIFLGYAIFRIRKWYFLKKKPEHRREFTSICFGVFLAVMVIICAVSSPKDTIADGNSNTEIAENTTTNLSLFQKKILVFWWHCSHRWRLWGKSLRLWWRCKGNSHNQGRQNHWYLLQQCRERPVVLR